MNNRSKTADAAEAASQCPRCLDTTGLVVLAMITIFAAALRFSGLTAREIWLDESCTYYIVHHFFDWPSDGPTPIREVAHAPYFLTLAFWVRLFGETTWGLRSLSAVLGAITVPLLGIFGTRLGGRRLGLIAALLLAVNPLHVYYSQEARVYAMWALLGLLTMYVLYQAVVTLRKGWWLLYAIVIWALVLTHYYALLLVPATLVALCLSTDIRRAFRQWLVAHVLLAASWVPLIIFVLRPFTETGPRFWLQTIWESYPPEWAIPKSLASMALLGIYPRTYLGSLYWATEYLTRSLGAWIGYVILCGPVILIVGLLGCWAWQHKRRRRANEPGPASTQAPSRGRLMLWLIGTTLAFLLVAWIFSARVRPMYVVGRYDVVVLPAVVLVLGVLLDAAWGRGAARARLGGVLAGLTLAFFVAGGIAISIKSRDDYGGAPNKRLSDRITAHVNNDDLIISTNLYRWFMAFEWDRRGFSPEVISFPCAHDKQLGWDNPKAELRDPDRLEQDIRAIINRVRTAKAAGRRVWVLHHGDLEGMRGQIDLHFFRSLPQHGIEFEPVDAQAGLVRLHTVSRETD